MNCLPAKSVLAIFVLAIAGSIAGAEVPSGKPYQATGVKIGEVTPNSTILWTRLTGNPHRNNDGIPWKPAKKANPAKKTKEASKAQPNSDDVPLENREGATPGAAGGVRVVYAEKADPSTEKATEWAPVDPARDFTRQFAISPLKPATEYRYRVESRDGASGPAGETVEGGFRTAPVPDRPAKVSFVVVTGQAARDRDCPEGFKAYDAMRGLSPDFFVHTGDIVYYDGDLPVAQNVEQARYHWQRIYSLPTNVRFHRFVPSYFIKDDHDTWQDDCWPAMKNRLMGDFTFAEGQAIFPEQVPMGESTIRTYRWGKDLQIWLVEGRDFRSPNNATDGPEKTIWGEKQKAWFKQTFAESDAAFRILISPTPLVGPDRKNKRDNHSNESFRHEGDELRKFLAGQNSAFVVCGDRHWQYASIHPETKVREYCSGPLSDSHAGGWSQSDFVPAYHRYLKVVGGFLSVTVERMAGKPAIAFRHHSVDGKVLNEDRLAAGGEPD